MPKLSEPKHNFCPKYTSMFKIVIPGFRPSPKSYIHEKTTKYSLHTKLCKFLYLTIQYAKYIQGLKHL